MDTRIHLTIQKPELTPQKIQYTKRISGWQIAAALALCAIFIAHAVWLGGLTEDACAGFRFARNLARTGAIVWNPGDPAAAIPAGLPWIFICAGFFRIGLPVPVTAQALGVAAGLWLLWRVRRFGIERLGLGPSAAWVPSLFLAASGPFTRWADSGEPILLFALFLLAGCDHFAEFLQARRGRHLALASFFLSLATLFHPEGLAVFAGFCVLGAAVWNAKEKREKWEGDEEEGETQSRLAAPAEAPRTLLTITLAAYVVPILVVWIWRGHEFGAALAGAFHSPGGGVANQFRAGLGYTERFSYLYLAPLLVFLIPAALTVRWHGCLARDSDHGRDARATKCGLLTCCAAAAAGTFAAIAAGGDDMALFRLFAPLMPLFYLIMGAVWGRALRLDGQPAWLRVCARVLGAAVFILALIMTLAPSTPLEAKIPRRGPWRGATLQELRAEHVRMSRLELLGGIFNQWKRSPKESLATEAGRALGYYADITIYDTRAGRAATLGALTPTLFMPTSDFTKTPAPPILEPAVQKILDEKYEMISMPLEDKTGHEAGYFCFYELKRAE